MSVCGGSDKDDTEVRQELIDFVSVKSEDFLPGVEPDDEHGDTQDTHTQLQKVAEGKLYTQTSLLTHIMCFRCSAEYWPTCRVHSPKSKK